MISSYKSRHSGFMLLINVSFFFLLPPLILFSSPNGFFDCVKSLIINQLCAVVFRSKARIFFLFMLKNSYRQIGSNTNIKCRIINAGHNVDISAHVTNIDCFVDGEVSDIDESFFDLLAKTVVVNRYCFFNVTVLHKTKKPSRTEMVPVCAVSIGLNKLFFCSFAVIVYQFTLYLERHRFISLELHSEFGTALSNGS